MHYEKDIIQLLIIGLCLSLIMGCNVMNPVVTLEPQIIPTASTTIMVPKPLPTVFPTRLDLSLEHTSTSSPIPMIANPPTLTLPTKPSSQETESSQEMNVLLKELYMDNGGCRLPCWWGFQPGSTTWESARKLLEPIARVIYSPDPGANPTAYEVLIPTEAEDLWPSPRRQIYDVKDGIIENIEVEIVNLYPYGDFLTMIRTYGKPDEVWVSTGAGNIPPGGKTTDFWTALFYQKQGIIALYEYSSAKIEGKIIKGCPYESFGSNMQLWNPKKRLTFFEAADELQDFPKAEIFLPLHEATGLNVDSFYQIMNDSDVPPCLETPLELWP